MSLKVKKRILNTGQHSAKLRQEYVVYCFFSILGVLYNDGSFAADCGGDYIAGTERETR